MVVLVTGANGQLGQSLQFIAAGYPEIRFVYCDSRTIDITKKETIELAFAKAKPDFCINAAAYTAVDKAESEPEKAFEINAIGSQNLAEVCRDFKTTLIHISTDFVFDGTKKEPYTEEDIPNPKSIYGQTKLDGEKAIQKVLKEYFIVRTSWVYSQFANNFMKTILRLGSERDSISVVDDQIGTPTNAVDLARALIKIIESNKKTYGVYHFSNEGSCSWFDFATVIFELKKVMIDLKPITTAQFPTPAKRPKFSVLDKTKIKDTFGVEIKYWETSLKDATN